MAYIRALKASQQCMYDFLENLRQSGVTNMFGAGQYLQAQYSLSRDDAASVLSDWMKGHDDPKRWMDKPITNAKAGRMVTTYEPAEEE